MQHIVPGSCVILPCLSLIWAAQELLFTCLHQQHHNFLKPFMIHVQRSFQTSIDPEFSWGGGGGAEKIMCVHAHQFARGSGRSRGGGSQQARAPPQIGSTVMFL